MIRAEWPAPSAIRTVQNDQCGAITLAVAANFARRKPGLHIKNNPQGWPRRPAELLSFRWQLSVSDVPARAQRYVLSQRRPGGPCCGHLPARLPLPRGCCHRHCGDPAEELGNIVKRLGCPLPRSALLRHGTCRPERRGDQARSPHRSTRAGRTSDDRQAGATGWRTGIRQGM